MFTNYHPESAGLACPLCGHYSVHLTGVSMSVRGREDGDEHHLTARIGLERADRRWGGDVGPIVLYPQGAPASVTHRTGRRSRLALRGWCEGGCHFSILFTQHKGDTIVEVVEVADDVEVLIDAPASGV